MVSKKILLEGLNEFHGAEEVSLRWELRLGYSLSKCLFLIMNVWDKFAQTSCWIKT